jgi:hypothetical protein
MDVADWNTKRCGDVGGGEVCLEAAFALAPECAAGGRHWCAVRMRLVIVEIEPSVPSCRSKVNSL